MKSFKYLITLGLVLSLVSACNKPKQPEFVSIKSLEIQEMTDDKVTLAGEAILHNPNGFSVTVKEIDINVTVNEKAVGKVNQIGDIKVPAREDFEVPLVIDFAPRDVYNNLLSGLMAVITKGKLEVYYQGSIKMKAAGITFNVPIDYKDQVKL